MSERKGRKNYRGIQILQDDIEIIIVVFKYSITGFYCDSSKFFVTIKYVSMSEIRKMHKEI